MYFTLDLSRREGYFFSEKGLGCLPCPLSPDQGSSGLTALIAINLVDKAGLSLESPSSEKGVKFFVGRGQDLQAHTVPTRLGVTIVLIRLLPAACCYFSLVVSSSFQYGGTDRSTEYSSILMADRACPLVSS